MTIDFRLKGTFVLVVLSLCFGLSGRQAYAQGVKFSSDLSPAEGLLKPQEKPSRDEICLNGKWDFQPVALPAGWVTGTGIAPDLTAPVPGKWEATQIKIPSPWNVNEWGGGSKVGKGTDLPYAPSSLYYPSYPLSWGKVRMGWLKRNFTVRAAWKQKRVIIHFEAVAGECAVMVNGKELARNNDAYLPFDVDVTANVSFDKPNELLVGIRHRKLFDKTNPLYAKMSATYPPGSNTHDLVGIWQDVFLQAIPPVNVQAVFVKPNIAADKLDFEVTVRNQSPIEKKIEINTEIKEWLNQASGDAVKAAEVNWRLGKQVLLIDPLSITLKPGETRVVNISTKVSGKLKLWDPGHPTLYTAIFSTKNSGMMIDRKTERFGWRSFTIKGKDILLNGNPIKCVGDLQHPFGPYIMSRRFAWAWYKMIKDVGGNAVRPHAQPWPRVYYDLADEMGLVVLDEDALFGSSIALNLEEDITWQRTAEEIERLILRDRNHPSVMGWSVGNEMFAIALLNKPTAEVAKKWDDKLAALAQIPLKLDPTRSLVTSDGDRDLDGRLPVWSKHFGHGLKLDQLPANTAKPIIIGESGATYYGKPRELFPYVGLKAYGTYRQRSEALAIDVYQNIVKMAQPLLAYYSPSELCWFGIEHMNLGYHDYSRLPDEHDGIFAAKDYQEGKPGYQYERIPPYVTTFNPGLDPSLPVYKPLPMFDAMKAALKKGGPDGSPWDHFQDTSYQRPVYPQPVYSQALFIGKPNGALAKMFTGLGLSIDAAMQHPSLIIIDGENVSEADMELNKDNINNVKNSGGLIWILTANGKLSTALSALLPPAQISVFRTTALQSDSASSEGKLFNLRDLYFSEVNGDKNMVKYVFEGEILKKGTTILKPAKNDWFLFSGAPEQRKCAQEVLYENLQKPASAAMISLPAGKATIAASTLDYNITAPEATVFWRKLCMAMAIKMGDANTKKDDKNNKQHNLLMDGPVN